MDAKAEFEDKGSYLAVTLTGRVTNTEELLALSSEINIDYTKYGHRLILVDATSLELPLTLYTYFGLVDGYSAVLSADLESAVVAVAVDPAYADIAEFYELACANRGYNYSVFLSFEKAEDFIRASA